MRIAVVDGQGGGIGKCIIEKLRQSLGQEIEIIALGTNGASEGASGENAIVVNSFKADIIVGSVGIIAASSMMGELTPAMARAIAESPAQKILIPLNRCGLLVVGSKSIALPQYIDELVETVKAYMV